VFMEGNPRVYQKTSQLAKDMAVSTSCGPVSEMSDHLTHSSALNEYYRGVRIHVIFSRFSNRVRLRSLPVDENNIFGALGQFSSALLCNEWAIRSLDIRTEPLWAEPLYAREDDHGTRSIQGRVRVAG
jgi:hypothetical protein